jgi:20S proteasome alpha/beta subunit
VNWVGDNFVVLGAGNLTLSEALARRLRDKLREAKGEGPIERERMIQIIEQTLLTLAQEIGEAGVKERQLLIAGRTDEGEVCLWAVDAGEIYLRAMRTWECYGSGIDAAEMLMKDLYFEDITTKEAVPLLAYVVESVSDICLDCGGPVSIVVVESEGLKEVPEEEVKEVLQKVKPSLDKFRKELPKRVLKRVENVERKDTFFEF